MNKHSSISGQGSLLERAARIYDFEAELSRRASFDGGPARDDHPKDEPAAETPRAEAELDRTIIRDAGLLDAGDSPSIGRGPAASRRGGSDVAVDRDRLAEAGFILPDAPISALAEEFRIIKRQLLRGLSEGTVGGAATRQSILVCSAQPDEGKTFCALNLALSMAAEKDLDVLLIDGDFAKPEIPSLLGLEAAPGLIDAISDPSIDPNSLVLRTNIGGLSVLPAGRHANNASELLASARSAEVLDALADGRRDRVIIFDSPPALVASPASVLAGQVGQVLMVVRADSTTESDLREALAMLSACDTISLMLNGTRLAAGQRFGTYYGYGQ